MSPKRYLIVGGSAAGMAAAESIRRLDPAGHICVLSQESDAPYFRPLIPFIISKEKEIAQIFMQGQGPYQAQRIEVHLATRAQRIDSDRQVVMTADDRLFEYDRLLIATGSRPHIPPVIRGKDQEGVFALRTLADARRAAQRVEKTRHAVMLGGGLLNLKAAFALLERGTKVTLVVYSPEVLSQLMEPDDAFLIRQALDRAGLQIVTGCTAKEITADENGVNGVLLNNGQEMACQMVCIGKGVRPNSALFQKQAADGMDGVVVDKYTRTKLSNVHAAGDVAVTFDPITDAPMMTGLWTNAVEMGRCAGANMAGRPTAYGGTFGIMNATQVAHMPFVSMGIVHTAGTDYEVVVQKSSDTYRKLVFAPEGDRLVGALFIGDIDKAGLYCAVIRSRRQVDDIKRQLVNHSLHYGHLLLAKH